MKLTAAKRELFEQFARIGRATASPARLLLLDLLAQGEKTVETLAQQTGLTVGNTSAHLKELRLVSLVHTRKEGAYVHYRLASPRVNTFIRALQGLAGDQLAEARQILHDFFEEPASLEPVRSMDLLDRIRAGEVTVIDVRPVDEYLAGHIAGAVSIPIDEIDRRLVELPSEHEIVAYCRGPYCVFSLQAVETLRNSGYRVRRLEDGMPDWATRGLPVAVGPNP